MGRLIFSVTDEMEQGIDAVVSQTGTPQSLLLRQAIQDMLARHGISVRAEMPMGGKRQKKQTDQPMPEPAYAPLDE